MTTEGKSRAGYAAACCVLLLTLVVSAACGGESDELLVFDDGYRLPLPSAAELCGTETTWPDDVHFTAAERVVGRFKEKSGHVLWRDRMWDIRGARAFVVSYDPRTLKEGSYSLFGEFTLTIIDPRCPALVDFEVVDGEPGLGGLVWRRHYVSYNPGAWECWEGTKRYARSNLVVSWMGYCGLSRHELERRPVSVKWQRLNKVLTEIASAHSSAR